MSSPELINMPSSFCVSSVTMTMERVVGVTTSPFTLGEQAFRWPGERWSASVNMPPITNRKWAGEWQAFFMSLKGRYNNFLMGDPAAKTPLGSAGGNPIVDGQNQSGNNLVTSGWPVSTQGVLLKGDFIQVGSGLNSRLHMIVDNIDSDSSGNATLVIEPALRGSPADGSPIVYNEPKGVFRLKDNNFTYSVRPGKVWSINFECVEVL